MPPSGCGEKRHPAGPLQVPELPEVETIRRNLERTVLRTTITSIDIRLPKLVLHSPLPDLSLLVGESLTAARRRAKVLILDSSNDLSLLVHFKLSGQLAIIMPDGHRLVAGHPVPDPGGQYPHKATHMDVTFADGSVAYYSDVRQFGWVRLMHSADVDSAIAAFRFGPEGYGASLDAKVLGETMRNRRIPIKVLLLDQTFVAGLGNIYVDEALFNAGIYPGRQANSLTNVECDRLLAAIPVALGEGLKQGGAKIIRQRAMPMDEFPAVHGREGEPCFVCATTVEKTRVGGRGTYFCPRCQRLRRSRTRRAIATA